MNLRGRRTRHPAALAAEMPRLLDIARALPVRRQVRVRERQWREKFARTDPAFFCFVVEDARGELVGFAQANRSDNPDYEGELNKIYLLRAYQRQGFGRRLVGHVARRFLAQGITSMWLFGDARNPSRFAWLALGAVKTDADPRNGNYGWKDLRRLAEICPVEERTTAFTAEDAESAER